MSNVQITGLPVAISLSGTEEVEVVQSGTSRRATTQQIANLYNSGITAAGSNTQVQFNDGGLLNGDADFTFDKTTNQIAIGAGSAAVPTLIPTGDTNTGMWFPASDTIAWSTNGTEKMRILSSGNVGIGTTAPDALLSVNGIASFGAGAVGTPSVAAFGDLDTGMWFPAANTIALSTGGSERMRIDSSGNVGIGTSSPASYSAKLAVYSTSGSNRLYLASAGTTASDLGEIFVAGGSYFSYFQQQGNGFAAFYGNAIALTYGTSAAGYIGFLTSGSERIRIASGGNVGIGTSASDALLSVNGIASFGAGAAATPSIAAFGDLDTGMWFPAANTVAWSTGGSERARITANGLSIGTTTSNRMLTVLSPQTVVGLLQSTSASNISLLRFLDVTNTNETFAAAIGSAGTSLMLYGGGAERVRIDSSGNIGIGTTTFGTSAVTVLAIATGTAPTTGPADTIQIYSTDLSAGNTMLSLYTEGTVVNTNIVAATTHRIAIRVNGTVYYLLANTSA